MGFDDDGGGESLIPWARACVPDADEIIEPRNFRLSYDGRMVTVFLPTKTPHAPLGTTKLGVGTLFTASPYWLALEG